MADLLDALHRHRLGLFVLATGIGLAWLLWAARGAMPAFFIGLALAFVLDPLVTLLERFRIPRWLGVLVGYAALVGIIVALIAFALPPIARQTRELIDNLPELGRSLTDAQQAIVDWYASLPIPPELRDVIEETIRDAEGTFAGALREIVGPTIGTLLRTAAFLAGLVVIPVWLFYVLKDRAGFSPVVASAVPENWRADAAGVVRILGRVGGRWVRGQLLLGAVIFVATLIGLIALSFVGFREFGQFALILAVVAGILEWFPIIGPIVAAIPAVLIGLSISPTAAIAAVGLYVGIQQLENHLLVPKVMGDAVDLHPAVLIVALVVGATLFGLGGAVLAAPTVSAGRDLYRYTFRRLHDDSPEVALAAVIQPPARPPDDAGGGTAEPDGTNAGQHDAGGSGVAESGAAPG